jgi:quercetin dioxygenase-like cupin family protein
MTPDSNTGKELTGPLGADVLLQYQSGSIVSRMLIKKPSGAVTAFAFDEGEGLSEHTTPYEALIILLDGQAEVTIAGAAHTVRSGGLILLPAGIPHAVKALSRFKMLLVMVKR